VAFQQFVEEIQVLGRDLVDKVKSLIHEGNVQRIIVKDEHGNTFVEIPVTLAAIGAIISPILAAVGAISALVAKFTIVVVRSEPPASPEAK
jgi:phage-related minor tail protein